MIRRLWDKQTGAIVDIKLGDGAGDSYIFYPMTVILAYWEKIKKDKNGKHCHNQRKRFFVCYFCWCHAREVSPGRTRKFDLTHVSENGQSHSSCARLDKWSDYNRGCEIVLMHDPWISTTQSPVGTVIGITPWVGTLNYAPE